jgi:hypothetical protein
LTTHNRKILLAGGAILALSFLVGIALSFYQWDLGSPFEQSSWGDYNPLGRATYAPLAFAFILFPITGPLAFILVLTVIVGMKKERLWPISMLGFLSAGLLWLWYLTRLWNFD